MPAIRIVVLHNEPVLAASHSEAQSERAVAATVEFVTKLLAGVGTNVLLLSVGNELAPLETAIAVYRADVVLNLFEGLADAPYTEASVADILQRSGFAFTGSRSRALALARNKPLAKRIMAKAGLPTPKGCVVNSRTIGRCEIGWPRIVKPAHEDASIGIDQQSVVVDRPQLEQCLQNVQARYGQVMMEEYVPGREFSVAIVESPEPTVLPPIEFEFDLHATDGWPILTYDSKWQPGSADYESSRAVYVADLPAVLWRQLVDLALKAFRLFDCRDYARVDFRVAVDGQPYILEINPNPDLGPTACFCGALRSASISPADWLTQLVRTAQQRHRERKAESCQTTRARSNCP